MDSGAEARVGEPPAAIPLMPFHDNSVFIRRSLNEKAWKLGWGRWREHVAPGGPRAIRGESRRR
jgi:hypothetical protein